jgi:hypothetical protein
MAVGVLKVLWSVVWCVYEVTTFWQRVRLSIPLSTFTIHTIGSVHQIC